MHTHLVFVPKYRRAVFTDEVLTTCQKAMTTVCDDFGAELRQFNGEADHVHLLVQYPPAVRVSDLVNSLKGVSYRIIRLDHRDEVKKLLWGDHLWSPSYFSASAGGAPLEIIAEYIENQRRPD